MMIEGDNKGGILSLNYNEFSKLRQAMIGYRGRTGAVINDVLHNFAGNRAQKEIYLLMPRSNKKVGRHAVDSKSLSNVNGNLSVTVVARGVWHYLYFPDDGSNTRRHVGNQRFFERGGEAVKDEIIDRCIAKLVNDFEKGV